MPSVCTMRFLWVEIVNLVSRFPSTTTLVTGSRARCSWSDGPVTSRYCGLTGEPRDSRRLSLTTERAGPITSAPWKVTTVECWSLRATFRVSDLCLVVLASWLFVHHDWYDLSASGAVLMLPWQADLYRVFGSTATVECLRHWSCGSHTGPQHCYLRVSCESRGICHNYYLFHARDRCQQVGWTLAAVKDCCALVSQTSHGRTVGGAGLWCQRMTLWSLRVVFFKWASFEGYLAIFNVKTASANSSEIVAWWLFKDGGLVCRVTRPARELGRIEIDVSRGATEFAIITASSWGTWKTGDFLWKIPTKIGPWLKYIVVKIEKNCGLKNPRWRQTEGAWWDVSKDLRCGSVKSR